MSLEPPPFQESARCDVCKCNFNTFRRRHHCRRCGRTLCAEHSSDQMALPQFGLHSPVRVCSDCYNDALRSGKPNGAADVNEATDSVSRLDIATKDTDTDTTPSVNPNCTCGMPLCICEVASNDDVPKPVQIPTISKKIDSAPRNKASSSTKSRYSSGQSANTGSEKPLADYQVNGEGLREAIKNGDLFAVRKLLGEGVDANYCDKQGLSLLHLAAVFNQTEIAFTLMENGASLDYKNLQGETPLDCAPVTLQFKMKKKMEQIK